MQFFAPETVIDLKSINDGIVFVGLQVTHWLVRWRRAACCWSQRSAHAAEQSQSLPIAVTALRKYECATD
jgi:hypothetical protein